MFVHLSTTKIYKKTICLFFLFYFLETNISVRLCECNYSRKKYFLFILIVWNLNFEFQFQMFRVNKFCSISVKFYCILIKYYITVTGTAIWIYLINLHFISNSNSLWSNKMSLMRITFQCSFTSTLKIMSEKKMTFIMLYQNY